MQLEELGFKYVDGRYERKDYEILTVIAPTILGLWSCTTCRDDEDVVCKFGETPEGALVKAYIHHLAPIAVMEVWEAPRRYGLKYCCEDVVNEIAHNTAQAIEHGFGALAYEKAWAVKHEIMGTVMPIVIDETRKSAPVWGIEFEECYDTN